MQPDKVKQLIAGKRPGSAGEQGPIDRGFSRRRSREDMVRDLLKTRPPVPALEGNRSARSRSQSD
jgi:hypothetical protein